MIALACGCGASARPDVDAREADATEVDAQIGTGQFGDACTSHLACLEGYCVEPTGGAGGVCSRVCTADCPTGFDCLPAAFPQGDVMLCIPATGRLCAPCSADGECPGQACLTLDGAGACATACAVPTDCPTGYTCAPDATAVHTGSFCQPVTGSCSCTAELAGATRSCSNTNALGTCWGTQTCAASTGWSACTASTAIAESCDGVDNDCNFVIDNNVGAGDACTITNAAGSCPGVRLCAGASGFSCTGQMPTAESCNMVDDNCNGTVDEGYPGLGDVCSAGIGACLQYGSVRCNSAATGVTCGAVAGTPTTEQCNLIDDNCNGVVDETFTTIGTACSAGVGVCTRYGSFVCRADGLGAQCSASPGPPAGTDTCNYLDDDCDGAVDNGFRNPTTGFYDTDASCGACGNDCSTVFASAANATGACIVSGTPSCGLQCTAGFHNLNAATQDGCEFGLDATAIYVSGNDATAVDDLSCGLGPTATGTGNRPCRTISHGLLRAIGTGRARVNVADATYNEAVTLVDGTSLFGGYRADTWERHLATTSTIIQGVSSDGNHDRTVVAIAITSPTVFEGFVVRGSANVKAGGNSYALYISGSSANLAIRDNKIFGGRGGPGLTGAPGLNGASGVDAVYTPSAYDAFQATGVGACAATNNRAAYGGGVRTCGGVSVGGGQGGGNNCTPQLSTRNSTSGSPATGGTPGFGGGGGSAGASGYDANLDGNTCLLPSVSGNLAPVFGTDGAAGSSGGNAGGVTGCTAAGGAVVAGHWIGGAAPTGLVAPNGAGGGGGGAGGGATCTGTCPSGKSFLGGHGGGAGSGGCGGSGGGAGGSGGAAFAIFISGGSAPAIANNAVTLGGGGDGGGGGIGGAGGPGGDGGAGGDNAVSFCTGKGGRGGDGGNGGAGSGGGGGCGGSSFGIYTSGVGTPTYCGSNQVAGGTAGPGGNGGYSAGSPGGSGQTGVVNACTSN